MKIAIIVFILLFLSVPAAGAAMYKWTDDSGTLHLTDDYRNIPKKHRTSEHKKPPPSPSYKGSAPTGGSGDQIEIDTTTPEEVFIAYHEAIYFKKYKIAMKYVSHKAIKEMGMSRIRRGFDEFRTLIAWKVKITDKIEDKQNPGTVLLRVKSARRSDSSMGRSTLVKELGQWKVYKTSWRGVIRNPVEDSSN